MKQHKRGGSIGIGSTYYDLRSREMPQSGLSVYNFSIKLCDSTQQTASVPSAQFTGKKSNPQPLHIRKDRSPQLFVSTAENSPLLRNSNGANKNKRIIGGDIRIHHQTNYTHGSSKDEENYLMGKNAFDIVCPVGKGGFGKVWKVKCKKTGQIYAMKEMQKAKIINKKSINSVMN